MNKTRLTLSRMAFIMSVSCAPLILSNCGSEKEKPEADKKDDKGDKGDKKGTDAEAKAKEGETAANAELTKVKGELTKLKSMTEGEVEEKAKLDKEIKTLRANMKDEEKKVTDAEAKLDTATKAKEKAEKDLATKQGLLNDETAKVAAEKANVLAETKKLEVQKIISECAPAAAKADREAFASKVAALYAKGYVKLVSADITAVDGGKALLKEIHNRAGGDKKLAKGSLVEFKAPDASALSTIYEVTKEIVATSEIAGTADNLAFGAANQGGAGLLTEIDNKGANGAVVAVKIS